MGATVMMAATIAASIWGATIPQADVKQQEQFFDQYWAERFVWKFADLPVKGSVPKEQVPYSGYIYPDTAGGTASALRKYDAAFHRSQSLAASFEAWDTTAFKEPTRKRGLFGPALFTRMGTPGWYGHCNGWAAATIRHAEPQQTVTRNGVTFTPADIKGLLAELYIYNDTVDLSGSGATVNAGIFHAVMCNWVGRGGHGLGMESDPGEEKWNYPVYAFNSDSANRPGQRVEVKMNVAYMKDSRGEFQESPRIKKIKYFHYTLQLNAAGEIIGGAFHGDGAVIDMLWLPVAPKQARQPGHERGNPHVSVRQVLAIWRDSVPEEMRRKWIVVDPAEEDRLVDVSQITTLIPAHCRPLVPPATAAPETAEEAEGENGAATDPMLGSLPLRHANGF